MCHLHSTLLVSCLHYNNIKLRLSWVVGPDLGLVKLLSMGVPRFVLKSWKIQTFLYVLSVRKVLSGSGRTGRLCLMGKYIGHRLVAPPKVDNTFLTDSTINDGIPLLVGGIGVELPRNFPNA